MEIEKDNKINFLDLNIMKKENKHEFSIYRKETYCDIVIHKESNCCNKYKHAAFNNMVHRALAVPMNKANFEKEIKIIKTIANNNGFNQKIIDNIVKNMDFQKALKICTKLSNKNNKSDSNWVSIPYYGRISERIGSVFKDGGLKVGYRTVNKLGQLICNVKDKTETLEKSGVYKLKCNDCQSVYIGQTGRKFRERFKEHEKAWLNKKKEISNFADHLLENEHSFNLDNIEILHVCEKSKKLDILEQFEIHKCRKSNEICLNDITYIDKLSPLLDHVINL